MITSSARTSCRYLSSARALPFSRWSQTLLYSCPTESHGTHGSSEALPSREVGSEATGHVTVPEPSRAGRRGPEPQDAWQHRSPPELGGGVQSHGTRGNTRALPGREAGSGTMGHVVVRGCMPCFLPWPRAYSRGYSVCKVPTLLRQMTKIIEMDILYEEWYGNCEYRILKHEDTLLRFHSNGLLQVTLSLNFTLMGSCAKILNKM
jgi:hypothetical protein